MKKADPEYLIMPRMEVQLKDWRNDGEGVVGTVTMEYIDVKTYFISAPTDNMEAKYAKCCVKSCC